MYLEDAEDAEDYDDPVAVAVANDIVAYDRDCCHQFYCQIYYLYHLMHAVVDDEVADGVDNHLYYNIDVVVVRHGWADLQGHS